MTEALALLLRLNLAIGAAVALALVLRLPVRRAFGARVAYGLWALVPLAAAAMLLPARVVTIVQAAPAAAAAVWVAQTGEAPAEHGAPSPWLWLAALWIAGGLASLGWLAWRQLQFSRALSEGRAGPAVIGVLFPRIVTPDDFDARYTARERQVVLAHEQTHIARHDSRANAAVALVACVNWFNPLVHLLAHYLRIDQELACDAQVVAAHPGARRAYAEAMLKTQLAARPLPMGCYWPAQAVHPLAQRIDLLSRRAPRRAVAAAGGAAVAVLALGCAFATWAARPADLQVKTVPVELPAPAWTAPSAAPAHGAVSLAASATPARAEPTVQAPAPQPATDDTPAPSAWSKLIPAGDFGAPAWPRKIHAVAQWSSVEPGSAVRVLAVMTDPDGNPLTTDLTAFGSQSRYRLGYISRTASRYKLFTSVQQHGDRFTVTAGLNERFTPWVSGSTTLASGETGTITLPNGLVVTVTPTVRPETLQEVAEGQADRPMIRADRFDPLRPLKPVRPLAWL